MSADPQAPLRTPGWAHIPGATSGADEEPLRAAKALVPARFEGATPADHPALRFGIDLCNAGFYWEAHEVLEAVWIASRQNGRDRLALRAVIQLANAGLKLRMGRSKAALRLLEEVGGTLAELRQPTPGAGFAEALDVADLRCRISGLSAGLRSGATSDATVPIILWAG